MSNFNVDISEIERLFDRLTPTVQRELMMKAFKAGGEMLKDKTRQKLVQKFPKASTARGRGKVTMAEGIACFENQQFNTVTVSLTNRKQGASYLNRWFEVGTKERVLKKDTKSDSAHYRTFKKNESRGHIKPLGFFRDAREQNTDNMIELMKELIIKSLDDLFDV